MGSSEVSSQTAYEASPGRKVPSPADQVKQEAQRTEKLRSQAKDRGLRDKAVRGGGLRKVRQKDSKYQVLSSKSIPQWGDSKVSLIGDSSDELPKYAAAVMKTPMRRPIKVMKPKVPRVRAPKVGPKAVKSPVKLAPKAVPGAAPARPPLTESRMRNIMGQMNTAQGGDTVGLAQAQGMKVSPWAKMVSNPWGSMLLQMGAMSAIEPIMYGLGINSPILGGILPFMAMQGLPGLLESSAGIPRMQKTLGRMAERGKLKVPGAAQPTAQPTTMPVPKVASVAIPEVTTVFG